MHCCTIVVTLLQVNVYNNLDEKKDWCIHYLGIFGKFQTILFIEKNLIQVNEISKSCNDVDLIKCYIKILKCDYIDYH